jgi:hypothetical protein
MFNAPLNVVAAERGWTPSCGKLLTRTQNFMASVHLAACFRLEGHQVLMRMYSHARQKLGSIYISEGSLFS